MTPELGDKLVGWTCWICGICMVLYLMSDRANAGQDREAYMRGLESIVTACISDSTGRPVLIDDEWFLCGIVPIGAMR